MLSQKSELSNNYTHCSELNVTKTILMICGPLYLMRVNTQLLYLHKVEIAHKKVDFQSSVNSFGPGSGATVSDLLI